MRVDSLVPRDRLDAVITTLYADADAANWNRLPSTARSDHYDRWVTAPAVGGVLTRYMDPGEARSWIKDGPMKEYAQAQRGTGRYARFGRTGGTGASDVAVHALGAGATVVPDSVGVKPAHCTATTATGTTSHLVWGPGANFRNLLWAALRAAVDDEVPAHIIVLEPPLQPTPTSEIAWQRAVAARCDLTLHHLTERLGRPRTQGGTDA